MQPNSWKGTSERVIAPWVGGGAESRYRLPRVGLFEIAAQIVCSKTEHRKTAQLQWSLRTTDTLGAGLLSVVETVVAPEQKLSSF